jgi:membrane-associated phospholipid phosphatase
MRCRQTTSVAVACVLIALALGLVFAGDREPHGVDAVVRSAVAGLPQGVLRALVLPTEPYVLLPVMALLVVWCLRASRPWDALFVVIAPAIAVAVNTWLLKPLFDRWKGDTLVYPSGHTVGLVATLVVVLVLVHGRVRAITAAVGTVLLVGVTIGMVGLGYHYLTDVIGGALFAVFAVLAIRGSLSPRGRWAKRKAIWRD